MGKTIRIFEILLVLIIIGISTNCTGLINHIQKMNDQFDSRYGRGSFSDTNQGSNNLDKTSALAPYYSRINKLYEDGKITYTERNRRKSELNRAYDNWKNGYISQSLYFEKCNSLSK